MEAEYRIINFKDTLVNPSCYEEVVSLLAKKGWEPQPTTLEKGILIFPTTSNGMHRNRDGIQVLWDIATYMADGGHAILEITRKPDGQWKHEVVWLHLLYDQGHVTEQETPAGQWVHHES